MLGREVDRASSAAAVGPPLPIPGKPGQLVPMKAGCKERALLWDSRVTGTHWDDAFSM